MDVRDGHILPLVKYKCAADEALRKCEPKAVVDVDDEVVCRCVERAQEELDLGTMRRSVALKYFGYDE
jgi:hypothetical protein